MTDQYILELHRKPGTNKSKTPGRDYRRKKTYFIRRGTKAQVTRWARRMQRRGWKTIAYRSTFARSSNYRNTFFANCEPLHGKYWCAYCGRRLNKKDVVVDHIIPIGAVKESRRAGRALRGQSINNPGNLVAACRKCNIKKGDKAGLWVVRAKLGRHRWFHLTRKFLVTIAIALAAAVTMIGTDIIPQICREIAIVIP